MLVIVGRFCLVGSFLSRLCFGVADFKQILLLCCCLWVDFALRLSTSGKCHFSVADFEQALLLMLPTLGKFSLLMLLTLDKFSFDVADFRHSFRANL